jgi:hypothetical protein
MTYYNQLRDFVMENDEECRKDLAEVRLWTNIRHKNWLEW